MNHIKSPFLVAMIVSVFVHTSSPAQITITQSNLEVIFGLNRLTHVFADTTNSVFPVNIGSPGGPHVYDFTSFQFSRVDTAITIPINTIPQLIPRYPSNSIALRITDDRQANEYTYLIYRFLSNGMFSSGEASLSPGVEQIIHYVPEELFFPYPMTFGYSTAYSVTQYDTTYVGGVPTSTYTLFINVTKVSDGWGTITLPGFGTFKCLRWREVYSPPLQRKEFFFFTQEGYLLLIGTSITEPDSGIVLADEIILFVPASVVSANSLPEIPREFSLLQNYPNPFNPSTTIQYSVENSGMVSLTVYDQLGREVAVLVNGERPAGIHSVVWDASAQTSGVYFYRLQAGTFIETKKLILLR